MGAPHVIVVGAGTGGPAVMRRVLKGLPDDFSEALVVLFHSSQTDADPLPHLVQDSGRFHVATAVDGARIVPGHVFVVPRGCHATIEPPGVLAVSPPRRQGALQPAVDRLMVSAASLYGHRCIGLVLTGQGNDGTDGLRAITRAGGLSLVQSVVDSECSEMPVSVLVGDDPRRSLLIQEIAPALVAATQQVSH